jgi:SpoVK/Ycf46/Vps4 family AAA+-type ATPase
MDAVASTSTAVQVVGAVACAVLSTVIASLLADSLRTGELIDGNASALRALVVRSDSPDALWNTVGGYDALKRELYRVAVLPLRNPHIFYARAELRPPGAILLSGRPGTGKTALARAVAASAGVNFLPLHAAAIENKWFGESAKMLESAFRLARGELAPCIVFFDEIDGLARARCDDEQACTYTVKCELLRHLDDARTEPIMVMACTNNPRSLDKALLRRFTRQIALEPPTRDERESILRLLCPDVDRTTLARVAQVTEGRTGADLTALVSEANRRRVEGAAIGDLLAGKALDALRPSHFHEAFRAMSSPA